MRKAILVGAVLAAWGLLLSGCGGAKRTYMVPGGRVSVKHDRSLRGQKQTVEVKTKEGKATVTIGAQKPVTEAELGVPVYPGAATDVSGKFQGTEGMGKSAYEQHLLSTKDDFDKVDAFYKSHLKNVKGTYTTAQGEDKMTMFTVGAGKEQIMLHIMSDRKKNKTMIQVMKMGK